MTVHGVKSAYSRFSVRQPFRKVFDGQTAVRRGDPQRRGAAGRRVDPHRVQGHQRRDEVAPATRERVPRAAAELSFQPNALGRGLISGRTRTIGLLTDELGGRFAIPILLG
jgi:hypothetical protein